MRIEEFHCSSKFLVEIKLFVVIVKISVWIDHVHEVSVYKVSCIQGIMYTRYLCTRYLVHEVSRAIFQDKVGGTKQ